MISKFKLFILLILCVSASAQDYVCQGPITPLQNSFVYYCVNAEDQHVWAVTYETIDGQGELGVFTQIPTAAVVAYHIPAVIQADSYHFASTADGQSLNITLTEDGTSQYIQMTGKGPSRKK